MSQANFTAPQTSTLSLPQATWLLGKLNLKILFRGNLWWITTLCAFLPVVVSVSTPGGASAKTIALTAIPLLSIFAPLLVAGSIGEDVEKKTYAYLWSRPIPRSAFVFGKLVAHVPFLFVVFTTTMLLAMALSARASGEDVLPFVLGVGVAALLYSSASALVSTITPKHATGFALFYMLFVDSVLGAIPTSIRYVSMQFQVLTAMGQPPEGMVGTVASRTTTLAVGAVFLVICVAVTLRRSNRLE